MAELKLGVNLWSQACDWASFLGAARRADELRFDHLWTWDHVLAIFADPDQPIFEGYTALAAVAQATHRARLGLFVGANTFGTPETVARKDEILRRHCDAVGRDEAQIERSVGCKVTIRGTEAEAAEVLRATLAHNRTAPSSVADDASFWTGTPEQIAETMQRYRDVGFDTFVVELAAPYDDETMTSLVEVVRPMLDGVKPA